MSRYDLFRRRIAPIAFFLALALIAKDSCDKNQRTHTTVEVTFGAAMPRVRAVEVNTVVDGETVATFRKAAPPEALIGPVRFELSLAKDDGELRIDVELTDSSRQITRRFHAVESSTMVIALRDDELRAQ